MTTLSRMLAQTFPLRKFDKRWPISHSQNIFLILKPIYYYLTKIKAVNKRGLEVNK